MGFVNSIHEAQRCPMNWIGNGLSLMRKAAKIVVVAWLLFSSSQMAAASCLKKPLPEGCIVEGERILPNRDCVVHASCRNRKGEFMPNEIFVTDYFDWSRGHCERCFVLSPSRVDEVTLNNCDGRLSAFPC